MSDDMQASISTAVYHKLCESKLITGFGSFLAYQALVTFSYTQHQAKIMLYSPNHHAVCGNGCRKGMLRFFPGVPIHGDSFLAQKAQRAALIKLRDSVKPRAHRIFGKKKNRWDLQAAEHTPCEWIKFRHGVLYYAAKFNVSLKGNPDLSCGQRPKRSRRSN